MSDRRQAPRVDPFPAAGLVAQYKPLVLAQTKYFSRKYGVPFSALVYHAVWLATKAEKKFDPTRGRDFSALLRPYLLGLHDVAKEHYRAIGRKPWPRQRKNNRAAALMAYGGATNKINWSEHRHQLKQLALSDKLRPAERGIIGWMIEPDGKTLTVLTGSDLPKNRLWEDWGKISRIQYCCGVVRKGDRARQ